MVRYQAEVALRAGLKLGEGPCWHAGHQALYFVDILGEALHRFDPKTGSHEAWQLGQMVGTVAPTRGDALLVALQRGIYSFLPATGELRQLSDVEGDKPSNRFNDGKCDAAGHFYAGTMSLEENGPVGALYRMDGDLKVTSVREGVTISNGLCTSPDEKTLYYIDTHTMGIDAYDHDPETGALSNCRRAFSIPAGEGGPDGMTIDAEGMVWVAQWGGFRVCRYHPGTGEKLAQIDVPVERTSACAFGGPNLSTLYITTASGGGVRGEMDGHLFKAELPVGGLAAFAFAGKLA